MLTVKGRAIYNCDWGTIDIVSPDIYLENVLLGRLSTSQYRPHDILRGYLQEFQDIIKTITRDGNIYKGAKLDQLVNKAMATRLLEDEQLREFLKDRDSRGDKND